MSIAVYDFVIAYSLASLCVVIECFTASYELLVAINMTAACGFNMTLTHFILPLYLKPFQAKPCYHQIFARFLLGRYGTLFYLSVVECICIPFTERVTETSIAITSVLTIILICAIHKKQSKEKDD